MSSQFKSSRENATNKAAIQRQSRVSGQQSDQPINVVLRGTTGALKFDLVKKNSPPRELCMLNVLSMFHGYLSILYFILA